MTVSVYKLMGNQIFTREEAGFLFNAVSEKKVLFDFYAVDFMSRAAAHEFHATLNYFISKGVQIELINMNDALNEMLSTVQNNSTKAIPSSVINQLQFKDYNGLFRYLKSKENQNLC